MRILLHYFTYFLDCLWLSLVLRDILRSRSLFIGELKSWVERLHDVFFKGSYKVLPRQFVVAGIRQGAVGVLFRVWT
ncbi:MAG: hypothetical protein VXZ98_05565 [Pseudomonadota bacterium]|nr:hypothetical protein [Pseudomonadota bacterium]